MPANYKRNAMFLALQYRRNKGKRPFEIIKTYPGRDPITPRGYQKKGR